MYVLSAGQQTLMFERACQCFGFRLEGSRSPWSALTLSQGSRDKKGGSPSGFHSVKQVFLNELRACMFSKHFQDREERHNKKLYKYVRRPAIFTVSIFINPIFFSFLYFFDVSVVKELKKAVSHLTVERKHISSTFYTQSLPVLNHMMQHMFLCCFCYIHTAHHSEGETT